MAVLVDRRPTLTGQCAGSDGYQAPAPLQALTAPSNGVGSHDSDVEEDSSRESAIRALPRMRTAARRVCVSLYANTTTSPT